MFSRYVIVNFPGLGVGDVKNSSSSNHSIEQLLKYAKEEGLVFELSGLEKIGFDAFVKYEGSEARKSSVTARLASKSIHGTDDFAAFQELGGGDENRLPVYSRFVDSGNPENDVFLISIGNDESIVPAFEFIETFNDAETKDSLLDVVSAPLTRNEFVIANFTDFREAALEGNSTFAVACLAHLSKTVNEILPLIGSNDGLMVVSTTAIDATSNTREFKNELTPMMYHSPSGQISDLGLRLLSDVGPSIAEFFDLERKTLIGASMGKWMFGGKKIEENPQDSSQSPIHS